MIALRDTRPVLRFLIYKNMTTVETDTSLSLNGMELDKEADNAVAFEELLAAIGNATGGVVRDAGTRFETLIRDWFVNEPTYKDRFTSVQTWKEWADEHQDLTTSAKDTGIDLVGTLADGSGYAAIQCKFYKKDVHVPKTGIDSWKISRIGTLLLTYWDSGFLKHWDRYVRCLRSLIYGAVLLVNAS